MGRKLLAAIAVVAPAMMTGIAPAGACGGLVGENGTIQLERTTTLAAYSNGVERYVTAFQFSGEGSSVGSLVPLPDIPTEVVRGGDWTLQRLQQEVAPPVAPQADVLASADGAARKAEVILETEIDALDITVLKGGGDEVGEWAEENGFLLTPDAPEVLDFYAKRSPIFMAAKFDAKRAEQLGQGAGDSTPIMATIPTDQPWVPLRILGLGLEADDVVEADVFMLTDTKPDLLAGGPGIDVLRSDKADKLLLDDLRSDKGMEWVPDSMWLSYMQVDTKAGELDFDLAASTTADTRPSLKDVGVSAPQAIPVTLDDSGRALWPVALGAGAGLAVVILAARRGRRRDSASGAPGLPA